MNVVSKHSENKKLIKDIAKYGHLNIELTYEGKLDGWWLESDRYDNWIGITVKDCLILKLYSNENLFIR